MNKERFNQDPNEFYGGVPDLNTAPQAPHYRPESLLLGGAAAYGYGTEFSVADPSSEAAAGVDTRSVLKYKEDEADPQNHPL